MVLRITFQQEFKARLADVYYITLLLSLKAKKLDKLFKYHLISELFGDGL